MTDIRPNEVRAYRVQVSQNGSTWNGSPIYAADDAEAREQAGQLAANMTAGMTFKVIDDVGVELGEYARGPGGWL